MLIFALISSLGLAGNWEDFYGGGHKTCLSFCSGHGGSRPSYHRVHLDRSATAQAAPKISKSSNFSQTSNLVLRVFVLCLTAPLTEFSPEKEKGRWSAMQRRWGKENQIEWQLFLSGGNRGAGSRNFPTLVTIHLLTKHPVTLKIAILFRCISLSSTYPGQSVGR